MNVFIEKIKMTIHSHLYIILTLTLGAVYFASLIYMHDINTGDYVDFVSQPLDVSWGVDRWFEWSSRFFIEYAVLFFAKHLLLWKIITVVLGSLLFWAMGRLIGNNRPSQSIMIFCLFLIVNTYLLTSAGIFATMVNYMWPMACFLIAMALSFVKIKIKKLNYCAKFISIPLFSARYK